MEIAPPRILEAAKAFADGRDWRWLEPVDLQLERAQPGERIWSVRTNVHAMGCNVWLLVREADGAVIESAFLPR